MGLKSPFSYAMYEQLMIKTFINLLDDYCGSCHSNCDWNDDCNKCPVGNLINECRDYIIGYYPSQSNDEMNKKYHNLMKDTAREVKKIKQCPLFNVTWVLQDEPSKDRLDKIKMNLKKLEHYKSKMDHAMFFDKTKKKKIAKQLKIQAITGK